MRGSSSTTRMVATVATILRSGIALLRFGRRRGWGRRRAGCRLLAVRALVPVPHPLVDGGGNAATVHAPAAAAVAPAPPPAEQAERHDPEEDEAEEQEEQQAEDPAEPEE